MNLSEIDFHPPERKLRVFAVLFVATATGLAAWQGWMHERWTFAGLLFGVGFGVALLGLIKPWAVRPIYVGMTLVSFPFGWLTSHLLLATVYFGLFTPLALLFRILGRDALRLRPRKSDSSYLEKKRQPSDSRSYFRPF